MRILFVCNANLQRSPTAESLFEDSNHEAKSVGIHPLAQTSITKQSVEWADEIFVMENFQKDFILQRFSKQVKNKPIHVLNIPDVYYRDDPQLIKILKEKLKDYLNKNI